METLSVTTTLTVTVAEVRMFTDSSSSEAADAVYKHFSSLVQTIEIWNNYVLVILTILSIAGGVFAFLGYRNYKEWRKDMDERVTEIATRTTIKTMEGKQGLENVESDPSRSFLTTQKQPTPRRKEHD